MLYLLLALSVVSLGVLFERAWYFTRRTRRGGDRLRAEVLAALQADGEEAASAVLARSDAYEGRVVGVAWSYRAGGGHAVLEALDAEVGRARRDLERGLNFLGTIGNNAPFIGLFGTVIGVIVAFDELGSAAARAGAMGNVMSGIAEALVATGVGLFVALPAVIAYNVLTKHIADLEQEAMALGKHLSASLAVAHRTSPNEAPALRVVAAPAEGA